MNPATKTSAIRVAVALETSNFNTNEIFTGIVKYNQPSQRYEFRSIVFDEQGEIPRKLRGLHADGAIIAITAKMFENLHSEFPSGLPIVNVCADPLGHGVQGVCADDRMLVKLSLEHLRQNGFERFAYVGQKDAPGSLRRGKILKELVPNVVMHDMDWVEWDGNDREPESNAALEAWLSKLALPIGIIVYTGQNARCVCLACVSVGLEIPRDVGVVSMFDEHWCITSAPTISAMRCQGEKLGHEAMRLLDGLVTRGLKATEMVKVAPRDVIARESTQAVDVDEQQVQRALEYIEENACKGITVKEVLRVTQPGSRTKFYEDFKELVGHSPAEHIRKLKIDRAKELLLNGLLSVTRIANMCGFENATLFGQTFSNVVGMTPTAYRTKMHKPTK